MKQLTNSASNVNRKVVPLRDTTVDKGICQLLAEEHGTTARPGQSKIVCPQCGKRTLAVKADDSLAKCFHSECGWSLTRWHKETEHKQGIYAIHQELARITRAALLAQKGTGGQAWNYLIDRKIHPQIIEIAPLGAVPPDIETKIDELFQPLIQKAEAEVPPKKVGRPSRDEVTKQAGLKMLKEAYAKAKACFRNVGWLVFFNTDQWHRVLSFKFRKPFSKNPDDKRFYKPFPRAGIFGHGVFTPFEADAYQQNNRLIIVEGEFNQLQLLSAAVRYGEATSKPPKLPHAAAIGSADGGDLITVKAICEHPIYWHDNDDAGRGSVKRGQEIMHLDAVTAPTKDFDPDDFILSFGDDFKAAWEGIQKLLGARKSASRNYESVAREIYWTRQKQGPDDRRREHEINAQVTDLILSDLRERGRFYRAVEGPYFFCHETGELVPIQRDDAKFIILLSRYGLNGSEKLFPYVFSALLVEALDNGAETTIHRTSYFDQSTFTLYVPNNAGRVYKITPCEKITLVENGTDGVLFLQDPVAQPFNYNPELIIDRRCLLNDLLFDQMSLADDGLLLPEECRILLELHLYSTFFESIMPTKPIVVFVGERGTFKTSHARKLGWIVIGSHFEVSAIPEKRDDCETLLSNRRLVVLDNADVYEAWFENLLALVATSGAIPRRLLYSTNTLIDYPLRCFVVITSRTPHFRRPDVAERLLIIKTSKPATYKAQAEIANGFLSQRDRMMTELLSALQHVVKALKAAGSAEQWTSFRMADFGSFCMKIARSRGSEEEERVRSIFQKLSSEQTAFSLEQDDSLVDLLICWANKDMNSTRFVTNLDLYKDLCALAHAEGIPFEYGHPKKQRGFTVKIAALRPLLDKTHFRIEVKQLRANRKAFRYVPIDG